MRIMKLAAALLLAATVAAPLQSAMAQAPIVIKFSHVVTENTPKGKASLKFKELVEQYTAGKVKVEVYPNSTLYKDGEEMQALQLGAVQMLAPSTAKFAPLGVKQFEALDLPYIFNGQKAYDTIINGPVGKDLLARLEPKGIHGLAYWDNGFYVISANKPLLVPDDLKGLKIRISGSKIDDATLRLMGANPQIMAFSELYQALQSGVVDGAQNTPSNYTSQKFDEVQKYMNVINHVHLQYAVITSKKFWDSLPADIKPMVQKAMDEATVYNNSISVQENADAMAKMRKDGKVQIHDPSPAELKVWHDAMMPVYTSASSRIGQDMIDVMTKAAAAVK